MLLPEKVSGYESDDREEAVGQEKPTRTEKQSHLSVKSLINRTHLHQIEMGIKSKILLGSHQFNPPDLSFFLFFLIEAMMEKRFMSFTHSKVEFLRQKWTLYPQEEGLEGRI